MTGAPRLSIFGNSTSDSHGISMPGALIHEKYTPMDSAKESPPDEDLANSPCTGVGNVVEIDC